VEMVYIGRKVEQVMVNIMESVGKTDAKPAVYRRTRMTGKSRIGRRNAQLQDAHMAAATAGFGQDGTAGGRQAATLIIMVVVMVLGAGLVFAVPMGENAERRRPGLSPATAGEK